MHTKESLTLRFDEIGKLKDGWLDGDGTSYDKEFLDKVRDSLLNLMEMGLPPPAVFPNPEGEIHLEWITGFCFLVYVEPTGKATALFNDNDDEIEFDFFSPQGQYDFLLYYNA